MYVYTGFIKTGLVLSVRFAFRHQAIEIAKTIMGAGPIFSRPKRRRISHRGRSVSATKAKFALLPLSRKPIDFVNSPEETEGMDW